MLINKQNEVYLWKYFIQKQEELGNLNGYIEDGDYIKNIQPQTTYEEFVKYIKDNKLY